MVYKRYKIFLYTLSKATGPHYLLFFIIAVTTRDLLIMHACDTFCDELILLHINYVISIHCNYFTVNIPVFMKYIPVQIFKTIM